MKSLVECIKTWPKVEPMPQIGFTFLKNILGTETGPAHSHFDIRPSLCFSERFEMSVERSQLLDAFDERFAVVREGQ
ncbi:MAG: hypothetical protein JSR31_06410 [Nitrospira sp.]|nr:hypothetical protein [Nitrospira sp.]